MYASLFPYSLHVIVVSHIIDPLVTRIHTARAIARYIVKTALHGEWFLSVNSLCRYVRVLSVRANAINTCIMTCTL